jgi:hypothetical protein
VYLLFFASQIVVFSGFGPCAWNKFFCGVLKREPRRKIFHFKAWYIITHTAVTILVYNTVFLCLNLRYTIAGHRVARATIFGTVTANALGSAGWNLLHVTVLVPGILRQFFRVMHPWMKNMRALFKLLTVIAIISSLRFIRLQRPDITLEDS